MNLKALFAAAVGGLLIAGNTEPRLPSGWSRQASFGSDRACSAGQTALLREGGRRVLTIDCHRAFDGYMAVAQTIAADEYRGLRVRVVARVRGEKIAGQGGVFMRVTGPDARVLAYDDMSTRPLRGDVAWRDAQVVLDVDREATSIAFGVRLADGLGMLQADAFRFEIVAPDDETLSIRLQPQLPFRPQNLDLQ